ncbi:hypothetical protein [uncultured Helicobacter sp.]|uniref:hypothetical protein n=1 Tax=uncultured Helicobacter sp. TaxID=175537 RepID=UPI00375228A5
MPSINNMRVSVTKKAVLYSFWGFESAGRGKPFLRQNNTQNLKKIQKAQNLKEIQNLSN